jgi:uncharacterized protein YndB with AHSA1/START domain
MATANKAAPTEFSTPSDREIMVRRVFDAPRRLVWDAFTKCEHMKQWMTGPDGWTMTVCQMDLRPGGKIKWTWRREDGTEMTITGVTKEVTPPERYVMTESWGDPWPESLNTLVLLEKGGKTTLTQTLLYPSKEARDAALGTGMKDGMVVSYDRLEAFLRNLA